MIIDDHVHIGRLQTVKNEKRTPVTPEGLIKKMDEEGIDKAIVLPIVSPETGFFPSTSEEVLKACEKYPDRLIPYCNLDPRAAGNKPDTDFSWVLEEYKERGCKGVGEITANLYIDDARVKNFFYHCGKLKLPVLFHLATKVGEVYGLADDIHLPRLEKILQEFPETIFIGHAMAFWSEISAKVDEKTRGGYPKGPVKEGGRLPQLLRKYPNLYADLSAGSGYNGISRDLNYGYKFLKEFQDKLFFGTDICFAEQELPQVKFLKEGLKEGKISKQAYEKITHQNIEKLLGI